MSPDLECAYGVTGGLMEEFGEDRVRDTAISEQAITGAAVGAALTGMRPVVDFHFSDFVTCGMDEIVNQAAKIRYMFGGQAKLPPLALAREAEEEEDGKLVRPVL